MAISAAMKLSRWVQAPEAEVAPKAAVRDEARAERSGGGNNASGEQGCRWVRLEHGGTVLSFGPAGPKAPLPLLFCGWLGWR